MLNVELNVQISKCRTVDEVICLVGQRGSEFNVVNCVTALQRIAKLPDGVACYVDVNDDRSPIASLLARATACFSSVNPSKYDKPQPRHVAGALWACAKLHFPMEACGHTVRAAVVAGAALNPAWYKPQELSMVVWALGKLASSNSSISTSARMKSGRSSSEGSGEVSANQRFVATLSLSAMKRIGDFDSQGLANLVQGAAGVGFPHDSFCPGGGGGAGLAQKLTMCLLGRMAALSSQELANVLAGLAKLEVSLDLVPGLAAEAAAAVSSQLPNFSPQQLANVAWASAKLAASPSSSSTSVQSTGYHENHDVSGLSFWAILAPTLTQRAYELNSQELSMCCWAASTSLHGSSSSFSSATSTAPAAVATLVQALGGGACNACSAQTLHVPQQVSTIVLALGKLGATDRTHLAALSRAARKGNDDKLCTASGSGRAYKYGGLGNYGWVDLDNLTSGFARHELQWRSPKLVKGIANAAANLLLTSSEQQQSHKSNVLLPSRSIANVLTSVAKMASTCKQLQLASLLVVATCRALLSPDVTSKECAQNDNYSPDDPIPLHPLLLNFNLRDCANAAWGLGVLSGGVDASSKEYAGVQRCVASLGQRGADCLDQQTYGAQECSRLLYALSLVNVRVAALEAAAGASRLLSFDFVDPVGKLELTQCFAGTQKDATQREATGTIAGNGGALFEDAPVLAHFLARHSTPAKLSKALLGESNEAHAADKSALVEVLRALERTAAASKSNGMSNMRCVELGAGLGLCSMVCTRLGMRVVATDGDASVLEALKANAQRDSGAEANAASTSTGGSSKLERGDLLAHLLQWGNAESIEHVKKLGGGETRREEADGSGSFDLIIATGCVYGRESGVWQQLVDTLVALSTPKHTLVLLAHGTGAAPGTLALRGDFYALADPWFYVGRAPPTSSNHPDHPGVQVHYLVRRSEGDSAQRTRSKRQSDEASAHNSEEIASKKHKKLHVK